MKTYVATSRNKNLVYCIHCDKPELWLKQLPEGYTIMEDDIDCYRYWRPDVWPKFTEYRSWCYNQQNSPDAHALLVIDEFDGPAGFRWVPREVVDLMKPEVNYVVSEFIAYCLGEVEGSYATYQEAAFASWQEKLTTLIEDYCGDLDNEAFDFVHDYLYARIQEFEH